MNILKYILSAIVTLAVAVTAHAETHTPQFKPLEDMKEIAFLKSNNPNADEEAALAFFQQAYPNAYVITPDEFMNLDVENLDYLMIWIHAFRPGLEKGWNNLAQYYLPTATSDEADETGETDITAETGDTDTTDEAGDADGSEQTEPSEGQTEYNADAFIAKLKSISKDKGVNLYLSGQAVQFVEGMDRISSEYPINCYGNNTTTILTTEVWAVSSKIEDNSHADHNGFAMFGYLNDDWAAEKGYVVPLTKGDYQGNTDVYPMLGVGLEIYDNNCMWTGVTDINAFNVANNSQVQGTWGQLYGNVQDFGIVEFLPDDATAVPDHVNRDWKGNILVNGLAACQWAPVGDNEFAYNLKDMTFNAVNYLAKKLEKPSKPSAIIEVEADGSEAEAVYYTVSGVRVAAPSAPGIYVRVQGGKAVKVAVR